MKSAFSLVLLATMFSVAAHASTETKTPSAPTTSDAKDLATCPHLTEVTIETKGQSLVATGLTLKTGKETVRFDVSSPTTECLSDIVCNRYDNFEIAKAGYVAVLRNNDGEYPTTDLPGHNAMTLTGSTLSGKWITCEYKLK